MGIVFIEIPAVGLGAIERRFGSHSHSFCIAAVIRVDRDTDTSGDVSENAVKIKRTGKGANQFFTDRPDILRVGNFIKRRQNRLPPGRATISCLRRVFLIRSTSIKTLSPMA